jgi:hypothetical protein
MPWVPRLALSGVRASCLTLHVRLRMLATALPASLRTSAARPPHHSQATTVPTAPRSIPASMALAPLEPGHRCKRHDSPAPNANEWRNYWGQVLQWNTRSRLAAAQTAPTGEPRAEIGGEMTTAKEVDTALAA